MDAGMILGAVADAHFDNPEAGPDPVDQRRGRG